MTWDPRHRSFMAKLSFSVVNRLRISAMILHYQYMECISVAIASTESETTIADVRANHIRVQDEDQARDRHRLDDRQHLGGLKTVPYFKSEKSNWLFVNMTLSHEYNKPPSSKDKARAMTKSRYWV